jgi:hypothetical protein
MKVGMRASAAAIGLAVAISAVAAPTTASAGVFNDMMRHFGVGWSDGYHAGNSRQSPSYSRFERRDELTVPVANSATVGAASAKRPTSPSVIARRAAAQRQAELARQRQMPSSNAERVSVRPAP